MLNRKSSALRRNVFIFFNLVVLLLTASDVYAYKIGGSIGKMAEEIKKETIGKKELKVCGYKIHVPAISYAICQGSAALLPANCTAGAAASGGGSCAANFGAVATSCAVSVATVAQMGMCCIQGGCS